MYSQAHCLCILRLTAYVFSGSSSMHSQAHWLGIHSQAHYLCIHSQAHWLGILRLTAYVFSGSLPMYSQAHCLCIHSQAHCLVFSGSLPSILRLTAYTANMSCIYIRKANLPVAHIAHFCEITCNVRVLH